MCVCVCVCFDSALPARNKHTLEKQFCGIKACLGEENGSHLPDPEQKYDYRREYFCDHDEEQRDLTERSWENSCR